jgi:endoglucanase
MLSKSLAAVALLVTNAVATIYYAGVAESSGEFGVWSQTSTKGTGPPGVFGRDYSFISKAAIDTYVDQNKVELFPLTPPPQKSRS